MNRCDIGVHRNGHTYLIRYYPGDEPAALAVLGQLFLQGCIGPAEVNVLFHAIQAHHQLTQERENHEHRSR